jgi:hypothetical protein
MARTRSHTWLRLRGSSPVVGSSRNSTSARVTRLAAMSMRRRMPPENVRISRLAGVGEAEGLEQRGRARARVGATTARAGGRSAPGSRAPVRSSSTDAYWPVRLILWRTSRRLGGHVVAEHLRATPLVGRSSVVSTRIVVVLPAPLGPSRPYTVPALICRSTPASARVSPNDLVNPTVSIASVMGRAT